MELRVKKTKSPFDIVINHGQVSHDYSERRECPICNENLDLQVGIKPVFNKVV